MVYIDLIHNLALLVALSIVSGFIEKRWPRHTRTGIGLQGLLFGGTAVLGMLRPLDLGTGLIFDGRSIMVSLCALFFGPWAAAMASVLPMACRVWLGGAGTLTGLLVILSSAVVGLLARYRLQPETRPPSVQDLYLFGIAVHLAMVALMFTLPEGTGMAVIRRIGPPVLLLYPLATILAGKILSDQVKAGQQLAALLESEKRYRLLVENANEMILVAQEGRIAFANRKTIDFLGYDPEELEGAPFIDYIHGEDRALVADRHQKRLKGEPLPEVYPFRIVDRAGKTRWVQINAVRIDWRGRPATLNFLSDITERRQLEEELRQRELYLSKIFDVLPIGLWFADKNGKLIRGNPAGVKIWGAEPKVSLEEYGVFKARRLPSGEEIAPDDWALA
ncbi:MAG: PAS domain S-box protein, partial [Thermodesulfobacteriota bacterium]